MKLMALLLFIAFTSPLNYVIEIEGNSVYENACRYNIQGWIYVHIEGDPYERGYQHGYLLYAEIADMIYRWSNIIHNCPVIVKYLPIDINSSKYEELAKLWWENCKKLAMKIFWPYYPEEYKEEIKGIADGAKARGVKIYGKLISYEDILTLNEMYELMSILTNPQKRFHLLKDIFNSLATIFPSLKGKEYEFSLAFYPTHHCNGFAAVGNATKDGNIVISDSVWCGGWWYSYYIAQRWNVILDIEPSSGHRLIIATSPGYIWSDEDYWQNDAGIAMIETTFIQGIYRLKGLPLAIRARMAIQYGSSIDDVIKFLLKENTGVMNAQWLIADAKEKEIALLEFGLYSYNVIRKKDGFLWSANNPFDFWVRREIIGYEVLKAPLFRLAHIILNATGYQYYTLFYTPSERDIKFEELGKKYYGEIDAEIVKKIMSTPPITDYTTDCKITDGSLIFNNSLWAFWGNMHRVWNTSHLYKLKGVKDVPPAGWVKIVGVPYDFKPNYKKGNCNKGENAKIEWEYEFDEGKNYNYANLKGNGKICAYFKNFLYVLDENGKLLWKKGLDGKINDVEISNEIIYVITDNVSYKFSMDGELLDKGIGGKDIEIDNKIWISSDNLYVGDEFDKLSTIDIKADFVEDGYIVSKNRLINYGEWEFVADGDIRKIDVDEDIYIASSYLYCLDKKGNLKWKWQAGWEISDVEVKEEDIYVSSLDGNLYCLDKDKNLKWIFSSNASIYDIEVYGDLVFISSTDGRIYAIKRSNGEAKFSFAPAHEIKGLYNYITTPLSNIIAFNGKIFISANGRIYCINAQTIEKEKTIKKKTFSPLFVFLPLLLLILGYGIFRIYRGVKKNI